MQRKGPGRAGSDYMRKATIHKKKGIDELFKTSKQARAVQNEKKNIKRS